MIIKILADPDSYEAMVKLKMSTRAFYVHLCRWERERESYEAPDLG